jgi:hypothetical protein
LIVPIISLTSLVLLVVAAFRRRTGKFLSLLITLVAFLGISGALLKDENTLRDHARWLLESHRLKAEVLSEPDSERGELKHMEWDATGFAGVANNTAYLVFDPTDSLAAHPSGEFTGIPCKVPSVNRLERHWYSVRFYTDEIWGDCPSSRVARH